MQQILGGISSDCYYCRSHVSEWKIVWLSVELLFAQRGVRRGVTRMDCSTVNVILDDPDKWTDDG